MSLRSDTHLHCTGLWTDQTPVTPFWHTPVDRSDTSHTILTHTCVQIGHHLWKERTPVTLFWHKPVERSTPLVLFWRTPVDRADTSHTVLTHTLGKRGHHLWTDRTPVTPFWHTLGQMGHHLWTDRTPVTLFWHTPVDRTDTSHTALTHTCIAGVDLWTGQQLIIHLRSVLFLLLSLAF